MSPEIMRRMFPVLPGFTERRRSFVDLSMALGGRSASCRRSLAILSRTGGRCGRNKCRQANDRPQRATSESRASWDDSSWCDFGLGLPRLHSPGIPRPAFCKSSAGVPGSTAARQSNPSVASSTQPMRQPNPKLVAKPSTPAFLTSRGSDWKLHFSSLPVICLLPTPILATFQVRFAGLASSPPGPGWAGFGSQLKLAGIACNSVKTKERRLFQSQLFRGDIDSMRALENSRQKGWR